MILQALKDYYDRKGSELPPAGWLKKGIDYVIVLTSEGAVHGFECLQEMAGKKAIPFSSIVPLIGKQAVKHTASGDDANLLWDNSAFVLGVGNKGEKKRNSFVRAIHQWLDDIDDEGVSAVLSFYSFLDKNPDILKQITKHPKYGESILSGSPVISFRLIGDSCRFIYERQIIKDTIFRKWGNLTDNSGPGTCLITGNKEDIETCHVVIKGVWGGQSSGSTIIGFNKPAFESYGKKQGSNAPVGKTAAFAYTTALNYLLNDSPQRMQVGDASTVFWAEKPTNLETDIIDIFGDPPKDDPDRGVKAVRDLFKSIETGALTSNEKDNRFYVLGLSPNAARIAIRFWIMDTVVGISEKIVQHFKDLGIVHRPHQKDTLSLFRLLTSMAVQGKSENIPPHLAGETIRAVLKGTPYPQTLLQTAVRRIRAEQAAKDKKTGKAIPNVSYERASLIKACMNRRTRFNNPQIKEELKVSLDKNNTNIGYRLGRLFATLEKIQKESFTQNGGKEPNSTIRDRFYGAASGTPVAVFSNLMRLKNHHLTKLESPGRRIYFEKLIGEIMDAFADFPGHLPIADQGRFAVGYYHQNQEFYTSKEKNSNDE